jgi:hypothetical protein
MEKRPLGRTEMSVSVLGFSVAEIPAPRLGCREPSHSTS